MFTDMFPFYVVAAFARGPFQGNPAAVVFLGDAELETDIFFKIAGNFNQPMTTFVGAQIPSADKTVAAFSIRWFQETIELPLCGHGAMAAARSIFEKGLVGASVEFIELHTRFGDILKARRIGKAGIELRLPSGTVTEISAEERQKVTAALTKAFRRDLDIKYIGAGTKTFRTYLLVELDEREALEQCKIEMSAFASASIFTGLETGYTTNVITAAAPSGAEELFVSRMFSPSVLPAGEDAVTGSAHCLLGPYWHGKNNLTEPRFKARQVSARGGDLDVFWDESAGTIALKGETFVISEGMMYV